MNNIGVRLKVSGNLPSNPSNLMFTIGCALRQVGKLDMGRAFFVTVAVTRACLAMLGVQQVDLGPENLGRNI